jgi:hypothetical protein
VFSGKISTFAETQNEFNKIEMELRIDIINRNNNLIMDIYNLYDFINLHRGAHNNLEKENLDEYYIDSKYLVHPRILLINIEKLELKMSQGGPIHEILLPSSTHGSQDKVIANDVFRAVIPSTMTGLMNKHSFSIRSFSTLAHFQNRRWINWGEI